jgi:hypothetical protein
VDRTKIPLLHKDLEIVRDRTKIGEEGRNIAEWYLLHYYLLDYCHIATKYYIHFHQIKIWKVHTTNEHGGILAFDGARKYPLYFQLLLFKIM